MDRVDVTESIRFEGFRLDRGCLFRIDQDGEGAPVALGPRAFNLLSLLVDRKGELVSKEEIMKAVWPGRVVEEANLNVQISKLRHILDQNREQGSCIQTIPGRGYCFVGVVEPKPKGRSVIPPIAVAALEGSHTRLPLPNRPSIAVLPFKNMSSDPEQEYFSDGIAEDIITALSRYPSLFVTARSSCFSYKGRAVDAKEVGRELGVRYVLEGGLRKAGNRIRVTGQLVEAETGTDLWAERYDRDLADIFAVQDEITEAVTIAVAPAIADAELRRAMRKPPGSLDAWAAYQHGLWHFSKATPHDNSLAEKFFKQAIDRDPNFSGGYQGLAFTRNQTRDSWRSLLEGLNEIEALARRAVALDPANAEARSCLGMALYNRADYEGALAETEYALVTSPNLAIAHGILGATLAFSGCPKRGIAALERNIRLDPRDPQLAVRLNQIALAHYFSREYANAVEVAKRTMRSYPDYPHIYRWLAAALGKLGRTDEAREALEKAISRAPGAFDMFVRHRVPWMRPEDHAHMLDGLRKAGWREG
jgi:adenylate cyclase